MKILIVTVGSRGDVQPYLALAVGLQAAGHHVRLATLSDFREFIGSYGVPFAPLRGEFLALLQTAEGRAALVGKGNIWKLIQEVQPLYRNMLDDAWEASADADLVIYHPKAMSGYSIAEKRQIPGILALPLPLFSPTHAFPSPILPVADLGGWLNKASHHLVTNLASSSVRATVNRWRHERLQLGPIKDELQLRGQPIPRLYGYSQHVLPTPSDWDAASIATGYWFLERQADWQPSAELSAFLRAGPAPIYIGFGSMPAQDAAAKTTLVIEAIRRCGQRALLASGWGGLQAQSLPSDVMLIDSAPHDWLFPQMAAVVHHGGAGTTAAGLRAGVPSVICPFFGDQPFWGRRVAELGAGPEPIPQQRLTAERLTQAITNAITIPSIRQAAQVLSRRIAQEDGIAQAIKQIERNAAA
ncbi:MAG: glycosyltransferase [Roseiflexaceae bacterium]